VWDYLKQGLVFTVNGINAEDMRENRDKTVILWVRPATKRREGLDVSGCAPSRSIPLSRADMRWLLDYAS